MVPGLGYHGSATAAWVVGQRLPRAACLLRKFAEQTFQQTRGGIVAVSQVEQ